MSLWSQGLSWSLYGSEGKPERMIRCILAYMSMDVPRAWWTHVLQTGEANDSYVQVLKWAKNELQKAPSIKKRITYSLLVALPFIDTTLGNVEPTHGRDPGEHAPEDYLDQAESVLAERPDLLELGKMLGRRARYVRGSL